jgi:DNA-binding response OmpR family regulator
LPTAIARLESPISAKGTAIGEGAIVLERTNYVHIKALREKLGDSDLIETVCGVGYRFRERAGS